MYPEPFCVHNITVKLLTDPVPILWTTKNKVINWIVSISICEGPDDYQELPPFTGEPTRNKM